jgi:hypothetical protein
MLTHARGEADLSKLQQVLGRFGSSWGINLFVTAFLYRNFSNKSAASFLQSGNICRDCPAKFSRSRQFVPGKQARGKSPPERFFRVAGKSMFKRI